MIHLTPAPVIEELMTQRRRHALWLFIGATFCLLSGCGGDAGGHSALDATDLLDRYEAQARRHDPEHYVELDLGDFLVTRPISQSSKMLLVRCHLYAVASREDEGQLSELLMQRRTRMRDSVIEVIQRTDLNALSESSMNWMKSEMIPAINQVLKTTAVRDVVFSEFSLERG